MKAADLEERNRFLNQRYREIRKFWDVSAYWRNLILEIKQEIKENDDKLKALRSSSEVKNPELSPSIFTLANGHTVYLTDNEIKIADEYLKMYPYYSGLDIKRYDNTHFEVKLK